MSHLTDRITDEEDRPMSGDGTGLDCRGGVHSDDVVLVYTGRPEPRRMCGFHAQQQQANILATTGYRDFDLDDDGRTT